MAKNKNHLDLVGDGDDVEILLMVEEAFGIHIENNQTDAVITVGDLYDIIKRKLPNHPETEAICFSAYTFYRLRRAIKTITKRTDLGPNKRIEEILGKDSPSGFKKQIENLTGFNLPYLGGNALQRIGLLAWFAFGVLNIMALTNLADVQITPNFYWLNITLIVFGWGLSSLGSEKKLTKDYETLGTLAKKTANMNYGRIAHTKKDADKEGLWKALVALIRNSGEGNPPLEINRETTFFAE
ncbi:MAG: hypothetical protein V3R64_00235 [Sphingomonadales bacterium]